jgi:hypothetical protein
MPPRSVCLNVFTTSLGDANAAVNHDGGGNAMREAMGGAMERRDSAQSGTLHHDSPSNNLHMLTSRRYSKTLLSRLHCIATTSHTYDVSAPSDAPRRPLPLFTSYGQHGELTRRHGEQT